MRPLRCMPSLRASLRSTCALALLAAPLAAAAFDPNEGIEPMALPKVTHIPAPASRPAHTAVIDFPEVGAPIAQAAPPSAPTIPEVDPAIAAQAESLIEAEEGVQAPAFTPPAPLMAGAQPIPEPTPQPTPYAPAAPVQDLALGALPAPAPMGMPVQTPVVAADEVVPETAYADLPIELSMMPETLSHSSRRVIGSVPSKLDSPKTTKISKLNVARTSPEVKELANITKPKMESFESIGLSIRVQGREIDTNAELNHAYRALMAGDTADAIATYKTVLSAEPENQDALFGLASIYHRAGDIDRARPHYGELLKINPNHREGISNFMALISDEAPHEALAELERLEQRNPEFSPIPAQQGILLRKLGFKEQARDKMLRAIELAPENLTYKYNLAVFLDQEGGYKDAANIYRMLIAASLKGEKIPASLESLQKRLNYIATAAAAAATAKATTTVGS